MALRKTSKIKLPSRKDNKNKFHQIEACHGVQYLFCLFSACSSDFILAECFNILSLGMGRHKRILERKCYYDLSLL